jgi:hypothetical protein
MQRCGFIDDVIYGDSCLGEVHLLSQNIEFDITELQGPTIQIKLYNWDYYSIALSNSRLKAKEM